MALVNSIVIDLSALTATLTSTSSGNPVETLTYSQATNQIVFSSRSPTNILASDFLILVTQFNLLQTAILANFAPSTFEATPFTFVENVETNSTSNNQWQFYSAVGYSPTGRSVDYSALGSNSMVNLNNRQFNQTLNFPEWIYTLLAINHYRVSVGQFLNIG
jgi:hypothetical protein